MKAHMSETSGERLNLGARILLLLVALMAGQGCAGGQPAAVAPETAAPALTNGAPAGAGESAVSKPQGTPSFAGVWEGTSTAICNALMPGYGFNTRCHAINQIRFTILQHGTEVKGGYRCDFGNMNCRNMNDTGQVTGSASGNRLQIRVFLPDGTSCLFRGQRRGKLMVGGYSCYGGGGLLEQGNFNVQWMY